MSHHVQLLFLLGNLFVFVAERVFGEGHDFRAPLAGVGGLTLLAGLALRLRDATAASGDLRSALQRSAVAYLTVVAALVIYALSALGKGVPTEGDGAVVVAALWPILWAVGALPFLLMELGLRSMAGSDSIEGRRIAESGRWGATLALASAWLFGLNYIASERDERWDFRTVAGVTPSPATVEMARNLHEPTVITLVFPPGNDVLESIRPYFDTLDQSSEALTVEVLDRDERPARAKELRARNNGTVVVSRGETHESISLDVDADKARKKVKKLDTDVQQKLGKVTQEQKIAYVVTGHGERSTSPSADELPGLKDLKEVLQVLNYKVKKLGLSDGLAEKVPDDATIVFVVGPRKPMLEAELDALQRYVVEGGALFLAVDPQVEADPQLGPLLASLGVSVDATPLAHDSKYVRLSENPSKSDRVSLATNRFTTHDSTSVIGKLSAQAALVFQETGSVEKVEPAVKEGAPDVQVTIRSMSGTWRDANADLEHQKDAEKKDVFQLVAAVQLPKKDGVDGPGGRAVITADADVISDIILMRNPGNGQFLVDAVRWLEDNLELAAQVSEVEDVKILHTKDEDKAWFYGATLGVPAALLGAGVMVGRRSKRRKSS